MDAREVLQAIHFLKFNSDFHDEFLAMVTKK
jgi:hypothetical protein